MKVLLGVLQEDESVDITLTEWYKDISEKTMAGKALHVYRDNASVALQKTKTNSENSWIINVKDIDQNTFDLSAKNPNKKEEAALRQPQEILEEMQAMDKESADILNSILELV